ncbi:MAG: methyltransferase domain-containing protein, partial [Acidobacteriota bacterium]|nr:methyltransferase domain-containing protein [Acidobacteriota bacterium]
EESKPDEILSSLDIRSGKSIADIGSGGGYFAYRFAAEVGDKGHVYAVDVKARNLSFIIEEAEKKGINGQLTLVLAEGENTNLPNNSVDLIFTRNSFHHINNPVEYFRKLKKALRSKGRVVIIDNKREKGFMSRLGHSSTRKSIINSLKNAGYRLVRSFNFLDQQWFMVFSVNN